MHDGQNILQRDAVVLARVSQNCFPNAQVRHFELSNESWKTNQAAQYAWALLDWAPAVKAVHPGALIGANGPAGKTEVGDRDSGVAWWPQVSHCSFIFSRWFR